ncbi:MAG: 3-phosphoshikimate 1-carboxyvinyltransferase, partial [Muribaculaceae bacterium]|nr:3-phosphoshikimate 1-carboxyvinyltransferase [Muribaculaceae bacterium]
MDYRIFPPEGILETTVSRLPLSKSVAARLLILNALTPGAPSVSPSVLPDCTDTDIMRAAVNIHRGTVHAGDSGTALRFLTAYYAATEGCDITITGSDRLCMRPLAPLIDTLRTLGADIEYTGREGFAPLHIRGRRLDGGHVSLDARSSSQFASALCMVAPGMRQGLSIDLGGQIPSMPYLRMTLAMLQSRGIDAHISGYTVVVPPGILAPAEHEAERDWSAAAFWYAISAASAGWVTIQGLTASRLQGDAILAEIGPRFGVITDFEDNDACLSATPDIFSRLDMDMSDYPDLVPALAVISCLIGMPFSFTGVANLRLKESDRLKALADNLLTLGIITETGPD